MNTPDSDTRSTREVRHNHLRITSWVAVIVAAVGFPVALIFYTWATVACRGGAGGIGWCEIFSSFPWVGLVLALVAYAFVFWIIHELGHESHQDETGAAPTTRYAWQNAKQGYKGLDQGHHRLVRRVHRVASVAMAGLATYVSFMFFEADTMTNLAVATITYVICEILNWKTYPTLMKEDEQRAEGKS